MANLPVECDIGRNLIIDLKSITNCLLEMLFHRANQYRLTAQIWNIYVLISRLFRWYHTRTPVDQLALLSWERLQALISLFLLA